MSKHTPGPWLCHPYVLDGETFIFNNSGTEHIADVVSEANAQLIAAAPDLLEALQLYVDLCKQDVKKPEPNFSQWDSRKDFAPNKTYRCLLDTN